MLQRISRIFNTVGHGDSPLNPTELFNEGWMLRLLLDQLRSEVCPQHPFSFSDGAKWFSEALLPSPFLAEFRGDTRAEGWTNADGIVGHFAIGQYAKGDVWLAPPAKQLVVIEAKMFSGLSPGVKRCAAYDQVSRYLACIAEVIGRAKLKPDEINRLAFYVVAPRRQIDAGVFGQRLTKDSIKSSVQSRVDAYAGARDRWFNETFLPMLALIHVALISWEDALAGLPQELHDFYDRCIEFNRPNRTIAARTSEGTMAKEIAGEPLMSSDFDWDVERPERAQEVFERFDVQKAKQIIVENPRPVEFIDMKKHGAAIAMFLEDVKLKDAIEWGKVDVRVPVIFSRTKTGKTPIDGRHRLQKALDQGIESIPVVFLTEDETESIRMNIV